MFAPYPDDTIANMKDIQDFIQNKHLESYDELSKGIQGHAVQFPIHFLYKEDLNISALSVEYYVPDKNFT